MTMSARRWTTAIAAAAVLAAFTTGTASAAHADPADPAIGIPVERGDMGGGRFLPVVEISINGSQPLRVMLDSGSPGLVIFPGRLAANTPTTPPVDTGIPTNLSYNSNTITGTIATGDFSINGTASPAAVTYVQADSCDPQCEGTPIPLDGMMGVEQGLHVYTDGTTDYPW
jgi:hypothetical protein